MELGEDARAIVHAGFLARATLQAVIALVKTETGETVARSSLQRYRKWWRSEHRAAQEAHAYAKEIAASLKIYPAAAQQRIIEQKLAQLMLLKLKDLEARDPIAVAELALKQRRTTVKEREIELESKKVALLEAKLKTAEEREVKAKAALDNAAKKKSLSPEDLKTIREQVYGIA